MNPDVYQRTVDELAMLDGAGAAFDHQAILAGQLTPVFFGSAVNNFGVQLLLDAFLELAPSPRPRSANGRVIAPDAPSFSGFIFKIQANMDPRHRDRLAFVRVCSGRFERDMTVVHTRTRQKGALVQFPQTFWPRPRNDRRSIPGRCRGIGRPYGFPDRRHAGRRSDRWSTKRSRGSRRNVLPGCKAPARRSSNGFAKGLGQLLQEGVVQAFQFKDSGQRVPLLGRGRSAAVRGGSIPDANGIRRRITP